MVVDEYLIEVAFHWFLGYELVVAAGLLLNGYCFFDDHEEMGIILQVIVSLLVLPQHQVANANVIVELLLAVNPVLEEGL